MDLMPKTMQHINILHDKAFRVLHGRGSDVEPLALIRDLDAALALCESGRAALECVIAVLTRLVRAEYPEDRTLVEIARVWGDANDKELQALDMLDGAK